jgi:phage-related holin
MEAFFTSTDGSLLIKLIIAHIIADFLLQTDSGVKDKCKYKFKSKSFWLHIFFVAVLTTFSLLGNINWPVVIIITLSHLVIDYIKIVLDEHYAKNNKKSLSFWLFTADQLLHISIIVCCWLYMVDGFGTASRLAVQLNTEYRFLLISMGYFIVTGPVTYAIKFLTSEWNDEVADSNNSLSNAGKWIGILERIIILTLVYVEQFSAIGFLITAKSILRLIDKPEFPENEKNPNNKIFSTRKHTEYVLIGTFLSIASAIVTGLIINNLLKISL